MDYVVMDLEFNWPYGNELSENNGVKLRDEIIEIGAVKLNASLHGVGTFNTYVHPIAYTNVNKSVHKLTGISTDMLWRSNAFPVVIQRFIDWCGDDCIFISWSDRDIKVIKDNMLYHGIDINGLPACYDIQKMFDDQVSKLGQAIALSRAIAALEINFRGKHMHDALCDAVGTAEVLKRLDLENGLDEYMVA